MHLLHSLQNLYTAFTFVKKDTPTVKLGKPVFYPFYPKTQFDLSAGATMYTYRGNFPSPPTPRPSINTLRSLSRVQPLAKMQKHKDGHTLFSLLVMSVEATIYKQPLSLHPLHPMQGLHIFS
jgi:hypothetical protein